MKLMNLLRVAKAELKTPETRYNLLVQLDYLSGLCVAAAMGAQRWLLFTILLGVSLILGFTTVKFYKKFVKSIVKEANHDR
jgi:uncharacterized membrane protein YqhA